MLFDIRTHGISDGHAIYHQALVVAMPIKPFKLKILAIYQMKQLKIDVICVSFLLNLGLF